MCVIVMKKLGHQDKASNDLLNEERGFCFVQMKSLRAFCWATFDIIFMSFFIVHKDTSFLYVFENNRRSAMFVTSSTAVRCSEGRVIHGDRQ